MKSAALAAALNWHGEFNGREIKNRRSTLLGEKGYGLGICGTWKFFSRKN
jgi:CRISPR-associated protein Cmr3